MLGNSPIWGFVCECCHLVGVLETTVRKPGGADGVLIEGKELRQEQK